MGLSRSGASMVGRRMGLPSGPTTIEAAAGAASNSVAITIAQVTWICVSFVVMGSR